MSDVHNGGSGTHRVFAGTPEKVVKRRIVETLSAEGKPLYKALLIPKEEVDDPLRDGEIFITHRKISSDQERDLNLARTACTEIVVVVEALILLEDEYNAAYVALEGSRRFAPCLGLVLQGVPKQEKPTFSRFCFAFWQWLEKNVVGKPDAQVLSADQETLWTGGAFFTEVGQQVAAEHPDNPGLGGVAYFDATNLLAWVSLYKAKVERHQQAHPFKFIGHDVGVAESGLRVLEYVVDREEYKGIFPLLQVAIPHVRKAIQGHLLACNTAKRRTMSDLQQMASCLQRHRPGVDKKLREPVGDFPFDQQRSG